MGRKRKTPSRIDPELGPLWRCTSCGRDLPVFDYYENPRASNGLQSQCKTCMTEGSKTNWSAMRDRAVAAETRVEELTQEVKRLQDELRVVYSVLRPDEQSSLPVEERHEGPPNGQDPDKADP